MTVRMNKYGARKAEQHGYTFDSKAERRRYQDLTLMQAAGAIGNLLVHPRYDCIVNGQLVQRYTADFAYTVATGEWVVEDVKSPATAKRLDWLRTKKLMLACNGITVREVLET